jgi:hypothetical protein
MKSCSIRPNFIPTLTKSSKADKDDATLIAPMQQAA